MAAGASAASEWSERGEISKFRHNKSEFILKNYLDPLEGTFRLAHLGFTAHLAGDGKPAQGPFHSAWSVSPSAGCSRDTIPREADLAGERTPLPANGEGDRAP